MNNTSPLVFCDLCHAVIEGEVCFRGELMVCPECCAFLAPKKTINSEVWPILRLLLGVKEQ